MHHCHLSRVSTYCSMAICILLTLLAVLPASFIGTAAHITTSSSSNLQQNIEQVTAPLDKPLTPHQTVFLQHIFNKYGHKGVMTFEGFEHLLESLGLGELVFEDHDIKLHRGNNASFLEYHDKNHTHSSDGVAPSRLDISAENTKKTHDHADDHDHEHLHMHDHSASVEVSSDSPHTSAYTASKDSSTENDPEEYDYNYQPASTEPKQKCLSAKALLEAVDISYNTVINPTRFMQLCPVIVYELDQHHCTKGTGRWSADKSNSQIVPDGKLPLNIASGPIAAAQTHHHHHNHKDHNHDHKEHNHHHDHDHDHKEHSHHHDHDHNDHDHDHDHKDHDHGHEGHDHDVQYAVWLYSSLSVLIISLCGLLSVIMIPIVTKKFYQQLIQFLVALAIGSLTGDALLHLIPHAMSAMSGDEEHGSGGDDHGHSHHSGPVWIGMTAWGGICLFFFAEKILGAISGYREKKMARPSALGEDSHELSSTVGEKLYKHGAGSYHDVTTIIKDINEAEMKNIQRSSGCYDHNVIENGYLPVKTGDYTGGEQGGNNCAHTPFLSNPVSHALPYKGQEYEGSESTESHTHTHGHGHGHSHTVPKTVSNVAWMVILGDGMHNFSDGLAIGAAFADSVTGGLSTAIAVFCHELPHELGDFAMLLKAGMSIRQAICYNGLSSVLCFLGMMIGVFLGNLGNVTPWIFSATAGSFIYIALVDMVPELSVDLSSINSSIVPRLLIQAAGLAIGCGIMLAIALYEPQLLTMLQ